MQTDIVVFVVDSRCGRGTGAICKAMGHTKQDLGDIFATLRDTGELLGFGGWWMAPGQFEMFQKDCLLKMKALHRSHPTHAGISLAELGPKLEFHSPDYALDRVLRALAGRGFCRRVGTGFALTEFQQKINPRQQALLTKVEQKLSMKGVNAPSVKELAVLLDVPKQAVEDILVLGVRMGKVKLVNPGFYYLPETLAKVVSVAKILSSKKKFGVSDFKDALKTTRKYAVPLLEWLDHEGYTDWDGENRTFIGQ